MMINECVVRRGVYSRVGRAGSVCTGWRVGTRSQFSEWREAKLSTPPCHSSHLTKKRTGFIILAGFLNVSQTHKEEQ